MESIWPGRFDRFSFLFEKRSQVDPNVSTHLVDPNFTDLVNLQLVLLVCLLKNPRSKKKNSFQLANFCWHPAEAGGRKIQQKKIIPARDPKQCENKNKMQCMCDHSM